MDGTNIHELLNCQTYMQTEWQTEVFILQIYFLESKMEVPRVWRVSQAGFSILLSPVLKKHNKWILTNGYCLQTEFSAKASGIL